MVEKTKSILGKRQRSDSHESDKKELPPIEESESIYEIKHNLRFVKSYSHEFVTFAKRRWVG
jgi:hypothetical protein